MEFPAVHAFYYHIFSCHDLSYTSRNAPYSPVRILERRLQYASGMQNYLDLKIFLQISPDLQIERILQRSWQRNAEKFYRKMDSHGESLF